MEADVTVPITPAREINSFGIVICPFHHRADAEAMLAEVPRPYGGVLAKDYEPGYEWAVVITEGIESLGDAEVAMQPLVTRHHGGEVQHQ
jgi:hypothetical protein